MKRFIPFIISFLVVLSAAHFVVYLLVSTAWPLLTIHSLFIRILIFIGLSTSFLATSLATRKLNHLLVRVLYTLSAIWIGLFFYLFIATIMWGILMFFSGNTVLLARLCITLALVVSLYGLLNTRIIKKKTYEISLKNLPENWKNKKILILSDLHFGAVNGLHYAKRIVRKINAENPDIVFIVGDFFDGVKVDEQALAETFSVLKPKDGIFFVMGNHDGFFRGLEHEKVLRHAGMTVLNNQKIELDGVQIVGVDYKTTTKAEDLDHVLQSLSIDRSRPSILLRHVPTHVDIAEKTGISLMLSGHTHRGQMFPANFIASRVHKGFGYGLKYLGNITVLISSGIATWGPPLRVGTDSELVILRLT